jgi:RNA polymerase sigma-70 factor (ECF subfamily)
MKTSSKPVPEPPASDPTTRFVREYFAFVWRVLRRLGLPNADADDAAQRVMLVAAARREQIRAGSERAFLYRTAAFLVARERRGQQRRREDASSELDLLAHPGENPEVLLAARRARERLDAVLAQMPSDLRAAFVLFEIEGLDKEEVARALDIPAGTAASRLRRAREEFARCARRLAFLERAKGATT